MSVLRSCKNDELDITEGILMSINVYKSPDGNLRVDVKDIIEFLEAEKAKKTGPVNLYLKLLINRFKKSIAKYS